jgi:hypothetical protein
LGTPVTTGAPQHLAVLLVVGDELAGPIQPVNSSPPAVVRMPMSGVCRWRTSHSFLPDLKSIAWSMP